MWKIALVTSMVMAVATIYSSIELNLYRGIPIYHTLAQRQILADRPKCVVVIDRIVVWFLSVINFCTLVCYVGLFKSLFNHDAIIRLSPIWQNHRDRFQERHRKNVSHAWAHFLCWISELLWPIFLTLSFTRFDVRKATDSVVLHIFLVPSINFAWSPLVLHCLS